VAQPVDFSYEVTYKGELFQIKASNYDELVKTMTDTFQLSVNSSIYRIEVWSDLYKEWLQLVSLPADKSKLQILITSDNQNDAKMIDCQLNMSAFFSEKLNSNFKEYLSTNNTKFLSHFEKAVVFALKRNEVKRTGQHDTEQNKITNETLHEELNNLRIENRKIKNDLESLNRKLEEVDKITKRFDKRKLCNFL